MPISGKKFPLINKNQVRISECHKDYLVYTHFCVFVGKPGFLTKQPAKKNVKIALACQKIVKIDASLLYAFFPEKFSKIYANTYHAASEFLLKSKSRQEFAAKSQTAFCSLLSLS